MKNKLLKISFLIFQILFLAFACEDDPVSTNKNNGTPSNNVEAEVHRLINLHRTGIGLDPLVWNDVIAEQCRNHSIEMANVRTINHDGFNERINKIGEKISWSWAGENVAYN